MTYGDCVAQLPPIFTIYRQRQQEGRGLLEHIQDSTASAPELTAASLAIYRAEVTEAWE
jgi:hypothetical protein